MTTSKRYARWMGGAPTEAQRERNWAAIRTQLPRGAVDRRMRPAFALAFAAVMIAIAVPVGLHLRGAGIQGATLETGDNEQQTLTLGDGSRVVLDESTRVRLAAVSPGQVRLELEHGGLEAEVTHVDGRSFVVAVAGVDVAVIGTHFEVQTEGEGPARALRVSVSRGRVEVRRKGEPSRFVGAGESWSGPLTVPSQEPGTKVLAPPRSDAGAARPPAPSAPRFRLSRDFHDDFAGGRYADAYAELGSDGLARAMKLAQPQDLFEVAEVARWAGHPREAAGAFEALVERHPGDSRGALVERHPGDSRAFLSALELGRLRLNDLSDPTGAIAAFDEAVRLAPNDAYREDAVARRIQALEAAGDLAACASARDEYLTAYPQGTHAVTVARRCLSP